MHDTIQNTTKTFFSKGVKAAMREDPAPIAESELNTMVNQARQGNFGIASPAVKQKSQKAYEAGHGSLVGVYKPMDPNLDNIVIYYDETDAANPVIWILFYDEFTNQMKYSWLIGAQSDRPTRTIERGTRMGFSPEAKYNSFQLAERKHTAESSGIYTSQELSRSGYRSDESVIKFLEDPAGTRGIAKKYAQQKADELGITLEEYNEQLKAKWANQIQKTIDYYRGKDADWIRDLSDEEAKFKIAHVITSYKAQTHNNYENIYKILFGPDGNNFRIFERQLTTDSDVSWAVETHDGDNCECTVTNDYREAESIYDSIDPDANQIIYLKRIFKDEEADVRSKTSDKKVKFKVVKNTRLPIKVCKVIDSMFDDFNNKSVKSMEIKDYLSAKQIASDIIKDESGYHVRLTDYPEYDLMFNYV